MTVRSAAVAIITALSVAVVPAAPAAAEPDGTTAAPKETNDNPRLIDVLTSTGRRYTKAKAAVDRSTRAQKKLAAEVKAASARRDALLPEVNAIAAQQYRTGGLSAFSFLLNGSDRQGTARRAFSLAELNTLNDGKLRDLNAAVADVTRAKTRLEQEVAAQRRSLAVMQQQRKTAEKALELVGGKSLTGGFVEATSAVAPAAPRDRNGDFAPEGCTRDDPTTGGCITSRTLNMLKGAQKAGFTRFVGCYRPGGPFEHPKGRACDWSLQEKGFSNARNADMKNYGNDLMAYLVRNAERIGVLYVIWYRQVWFPGRGWSRYTGPLDHYDHVHVSML